MKIKTVFAMLFMLVSVVAAFALPPSSNKPGLAADVTAAAAPVAEEAPKPLERDQFIWQEIDSALQHAEANRRLVGGLGKCSQFAVETRAVEKKSIHDVYFRVGENRSPWPIGRIELEPREKGTKVSIGQNKQFSMGIGKFQKMWSGYLDEKYDCPPKPDKHGGGMGHP
jgi:hypothetical protein